MMPLLLSIRIERNNGCRQAFTLIEMVVMMSIFTAASISSITILNHLAIISKSTTSHCLLVREVHRLATQLRDEVHRCEFTTLESNGRKLKLAFTDGSTSEFELGDVGVTYRHFPAMSDDPTANKAMAFNERFAIEPHGDWRFIVNDGDAMVSLLLRPAIGARAQWQIDAAIAIERKEVAAQDEE